MRVLRLVRLALHVARGVLIAALLFPLESRRARTAEVRRWSRKLLAVLGVRLRVHGAPANARALVLVANHVSWLDILAIDSVLPVRFVGKAEIRGWPVIGWLSSRAGTIFIARDRRRDTVRVNRAVARALAGGDAFAVFPEGTTTDGSHVLSFHSSLLAPAIAAGARVQPVALRYARSNGSLCTEAAYDGDKSLWRSLLAICNEPGIEAQLHFLPAIDAVESRRTLAAHAREAIVRKLFPRDRDNRTALSSDPQGVSR